MSEIDLEPVLNEAKEEMEKSVRGFRTELQKVRTGRANPALLDGIQVDYYGTSTPLNQLANLSAPDAKTILIQPYDRSAVGSIERAIQASDLGLTPNNDGKVIRVPIPPLTEERRKEIVKHVKKSSEDHKIGVREARRHALGRLKELEQKGGVPADDRHRIERQIQEVTDAHVKKLEEMTSQKEQEILQV